MRFLVGELMLMAAFWGRATWAALRFPNFADSAMVLARLLVSSLPVVALVSWASGAMLTVQAVTSFAIVGGGPMSATLVGLGGVREVFPLLGAAAVAARAGAEFAATLGAMKIDDQVDAISVMGLDPIRLLVAPRVVASVLGTPVCVVVANGAGLFGAYLVGTYQLGIDPGDMWSHLLISLVQADLVVGILKGVILGWVIGVTTTYEGMHASGGPRGVGRATNRSVVRAMVAVSAVSLFLTYVIYGNGGMSA